jgi:hypothetical protein
MNTKDVGNITTLAVAAELAKVGESILLPFGDNHRYDIALDRDGNLFRIQCKTGRYRNGAVEFNTASTSPYIGGNGRRGYDGEIDAFGVYCAELNKVYLVPVEEVPNGTQACLRVTPAKNGQRKCVRLANQYEIGTRGDNQPL